MPYILKYASVHTVSLVAEVSQLTTQWRYLCVILRLDEEILSAAKEDLIARAIVAYSYRITSLTTSSIFLVTKPRVLAPRHENNFTRVESGLRLTLLEMGHRLRFLGIACW
jgi:hypothetical protein